MARSLRADLGIDVNPQALRIYIRACWADISRLAHAIHNDR